MKKLILIFSLILICQFLLSGQKCFKLGENQTFLDCIYKSITTRTEITDTTAYILSKEKLIEGAIEENVFISQNIEHMRKQILNLQSRKNILAYQKARHQKLIFRLRKKY